MEPKKVGRALGIGVRVASKMVQERVAAASQPQPSPNTVELPPKPASPPPNRHHVAVAGEFSGASFTPSGRAKNGNRVATVKRGLKAFGQAFLGPFTHAGSILWLEITGLFFALFASFFAQSVYRARGSWRAGPDHLHLLLYVVLAVGFAWFSASSFLRAHRKGKQGPGSGARS